MEGSGRWQTDQQSSLGYTSFRWLPYCRLLKLHFRHSAVDFATVRHTTDAVMAPDILFNASTLQRKYNLTAFGTCFQVFTAIGLSDGDFVWSFCSQYWLKHYAVQKHKEDDLICNRSEYQEAYMMYLCWEGVC